MGRVIGLSVEEDTKVNLGVEKEDDISLYADGVVEVTTSDYEKLNNLPRLNGDTIIGDMAEIDPTVPDWAKDKEPEEITDTHIEFIWKSIFKN